MIESKTKKKQMDCNNILSYKAYETIVSFFNGMYGSPAPFSGSNPAESEEIEAKKQ